MRDPLTAETRKERRWLLAASIVSAVFDMSHIAPSKISALGIEFTQSSLPALRFLLIVVVLYFVVAFSIYAFSDFLAWQVAINDAMYASYRLRMAGEDELGKKAVAYPRTKWYGLIRPVSAMRAIFEFLVPIGAGTYALIALLF